ncbi:hypothetical protein [Listeria ivanovii]
MIAFAVLIVTIMKQ